MASTTPYGPSVHSRLLLFLLLLALSAEEKAVTAENQALDCEPPGEVKAEHVDNLLEREMEIKTKASCVYKCLWQYVTSTRRKISARRAKSLRTDGQTDE